MKHPRLCWVFLPSLNKVIIIKTGHPSRCPCYLNGEQDWQNRGTDPNGTCEWPLQRRKGAAEASCQRQDALDRPCGESYFPFYIFLIRNFLLDILHQSSWFCSQRKRNCIRFCWCCCFSLFVFHFLFFTFCFFFFFSQRKNHEASYALLRRLFLEGRHGWSSQDARNLMHSLSWLLSRSDL